MPAARPPPILGCVTPPPCVPLPIPPLSGLAFQFLPQPPTPGGPPGTWTFVERTAQILNNTSSSISAWSMSIVRQGPSRIVAVTTEGTDVPTYFQNGFQKSQVTDCGNGATSAVILGFMGGSALPPSATPYNVLRVKVARQVNNAPCTLSFLAGQQCSGQPVPNVAYELCGAQYAPALLSTPVSVTAGPGPNTPAGNNIDVCLGPNVWVTFDQISTPQNTTAVPVLPGFANFTVPGMVLGWQLGPGGAYPPGVTVNLRYPCWWPQAWALSAAMYHNGVLVPGQTNDLCARVLSGKVQSFSEFVIAIDPALVGFRRGDANGDNRVDISDAVHVLGCQFLGTACSKCPDAADSNDDGSLDIGDAIHILSYQFQAGSPPPAPGPSTPAEDPTPDALGPCSYAEKGAADAIDPCPDPEAGCL